MPPKLKSIVTAYKAQPNPQVPGVVDIFSELLTT